MSNKSRWHEGPKRQVPTVHIVNKEKIVCNRGCESCKLYNTPQCPFFKNIEKNHGKV